MHDALFLFVDRTEAGECLAAKLIDEPVVKTALSQELLVLSIPRGGVPVGAAIGQALGCDHNIIAVKKIGYPGHEELAIGAMAEDGTLVLDLEARDQLEGYIEQAIERVSLQLKQTIQKFRKGKALDVKAKTVIVVDDGIATGETMKSALKWLRSRDRRHRPKAIVVAVPVCSPRAAVEFAKLADRLVCLEVPQLFWAVGQFYWNFDQVSDDEVREYLQARPTATSTLTPGVAPER